MAGAVAAWKWFAGAVTAWKWLAGAGAALETLLLGGFLMRRNGENLEMVSRGVGNQHASIGGGQTGREDLVLMFDAIDKTLDYCW